MPCNFSSQQASHKVYSLRLSLFQLGPDFDIQAVSGGGVPFLVTHKFFLYAALIKLAERGKSRPYLLDELGIVAPVSIFPVYKSCPRHHRI